MTLGDPRSTLPFAFNGLNRRYVTPGAFAESALYAGLSEADLRDWKLVASVRFSLFKPGGDLAKEFARNSTVLVVNDTVFAHGGLLPAHGKLYGL